MHRGLIQQDLLGGEENSPLGTAYLTICEAGGEAPASTDGLIRILVDREGCLPVFDAEAFDVAITTALAAPAPWVTVDARRLNAHLARLEKNIHSCPVAACTMARVLRLTEFLDFEAGLEVESMAYSMLLAGDEFRHWRAAHPVTMRESETGADPVRYEREDDSVTLTLQSPENRNAMTAAMRDGLYEALANVLDDPSEPELRLKADGRCFSTGGHLPEFGMAQDVARAHYIRSFRSCALLLHRLGRQATVLLQGACIGSGIEVAAAASTRQALPDMYAQLPELSMGLITGAGGCVTMARAVGRHRCLWMFLSGARVNAQTALAWGLVHEIISPC